GREVSGDTVLDHRGRLGGGESGHWYARHHRFTQGHAEARITDRVEEEPIACGERGDLVGRDLSETAFDLLRAQADEIEGNAGAHLLVHIEAQPSAPAGDVVDDHQTALQIASVEVASVHDRVLDHSSRVPAAVPHQVVEVGDVNDGHGRVVDRMPGVETRPGVVPRRIVLEVDAGQAPLGPSQDLVLVRVPVLVGLVEDAVESHGGDVFGSDLT